MSLQMNRLPLFLLLVLVLASCEQSPTDTDPNGNTGTSYDLTVMEDMPMLGGSIKAVSFLPDCRIAAILDHKFVVYNSQMKDPQTINGDEVHMAIKTGANGEVYAVTSNNTLRTYDLAGGPTKEFSFTLQYNLTHALIHLTPQGKALAVISHGSSRGVAYITNTHGETWEQIQVPSVAPAMFDVNVDRSGNFYFISPFGLYRSSGQTEPWVNLNQSMPNFQEIASLITSTNRLYVYIRGVRDLKYSDDMGATFTDVPANGEGPIIYLHEGDDGSIYAIRSRGESLNLFPLLAAVKRSTDGGTTWQHKLFCHSLNLDIAGQAIAVASGDFWTSMNQPELLDGGYLSTDAGATWESRGKTKVTQINDIEFDKDGNLLMLAQQTLFERKNDRWITHGQQRGAFHQIGTNNSGDLVIASTSDAYVKRANSGNWKFITYNGVGGHLGLPRVNDVAGLSNGEFLIALAYVRENNEIQSSGDIAVITINDEARGRSSLGYELKNLYQTSDGVLHATAVFPVDYQQVSELWTSINAGVNWQTVPASNFKSVVYFRGDFMLEYKAGGYYFGPATSTEGKKIEFKNFNLTNERPSKFTLDPISKRLYILSNNVTSHGPRILSTTNPL